MSEERKGLSKEQAAAIVKTMSKEQIGAVMTHMVAGMDRSFIVPALTIFTNEIAKMTIDSDAGATEFECKVKHKGKIYKARTTIIVEEEEP